MDFVSIIDLQQSNIALELCKILVPPLLGFGASIIVLNLTLKHNSKQLIDKENKELLIQTIDLVDEVKSKIKEAEDECNYVDDNPFVVDKMDCKFYNYFKSIKCQLDILIKKLRMQNLDFDILQDLNEIILKYSESKNLNYYIIFEKQQEIEEKYGEHEVPSEDELQMKHYFWTDYKKYEKNKEGERLPVNFFTEFNQLLEKISQSSLEKIQELNKI